MQCRVACKQAKFEQLTRRFPWVCTNCNLNGYCEDCGGTTKNHSRQNNIIADISMLRTLSMLEGDKSAMFFTNEDGTQHQLHGVEEVCLPFYDRNKAK